MDELLNVLRCLDPRCASRDLSNMLATHVRRATDAANRRIEDAWQTVGDRTEWESFVRPRIEALRHELGALPPNVPLNPEVTGRTSGAGYRIENLVYSTGPGLTASANLYLPETIDRSIPGVVVIHSHHNPKEHGELQDLGINFALQGAAVLIPDQIGYGERRHHAPGPAEFQRFQSTRQDYRYRYISGVQLQIAGASLAGWMSHEVTRGVDLLLSRPDIDPDRIMAIGAVAGGGDIAGIAAALDSRIQCLIAYHSVTALGSGMGSGSWESTRNLAGSGRDEFHPWVVVASVAPRHSMYAREFGWHDLDESVYARLKTVYSFYQALDRLDEAHGYGPGAWDRTASHCNQVGALHRAGIYPALNRWFGIPTPAQEVSSRHPAEALQCFTEDVSTRRPNLPVHQVIQSSVSPQLDTVRRQLANLDPAGRRERLRRSWREILGSVTPSDCAVVNHRREQDENTRIDRLSLTHEEIDIPILLLSPGRRETHGEKSPVVMGVSSAGKDYFLRERTQEIADLLKAGVTVCLPDVRGTGESRIEEEESSAPKENWPPSRRNVAIASTYLMLGEPLLGGQLRDVRAVLSYLRSDWGWEGRPLGVWGDGFAETNPVGVPDPLMGDEPPLHASEPTGAVLALLTGLFDADITAVLARNTFAGYETLLESLFFYVSYDVIVPGALPAGDLCDMAAALAPLPLRLDGLVDGRNCPLSQCEIQRSFAPTAAAYSSHKDRLSIEPESTTGLADWLKEWLQPN